MSEWSLPAEVVLRDAELEEGAEVASEALVQHRWRWTLDETNPERVTMAQYARAVARSYTTVRQQVTGYDTWRVSRGTTLSEAVYRAGMTAEKQSVTEAVAKARGKSVSTVAQTPDGRSEVSRIQQMARDRAEKKGTTVEEEAVAVAESIVKTEKVAARLSDERKGRLGLRYVEMEKHLRKAQRALLDALGMARDVPWEDEPRELLSDTVANVKALLHLIDLALVGSVDVDWDAELAGLIEGA